MLHRRVTLCRCLRALCVDPGAAATEAQPVLFRRLISWSSSRTCYGCSGVPCREGQCWEGVPYKQWAVVRRVGAIAGTACATSHVGWLSRGSKAYFSWPVLDGMQAVGAGVLAVSECDLDKKNGFQGRCGMPPCARGFSFSEGMWKHEFLGWFPVLLVSCRWTAVAAAFGFQEHPVWCLLDKIECCGSIKTRDCQCAVAGGLQ